MPEGPEIRRAADALAAAVVGKPLTRAWFWTPELQRHAKGLAGRTIESITPHGKALLTRFDHGWTLYSHNQLYGVWKVAAAGERQDTTRSLRVALETADRAILLYSASDVAMWRSDEVHQHPFLVKLGPDVLDPALDAATVAARLRDPRFRGRALAALLLDQASSPAWATTCVRKCCSRRSWPRTRDPPTWGLRRSASWPGPCSTSRVAAMPRAASRPHPGCARTT